MADETPAPAALWLASFRTTDGPPEVNFPVHFNPASLQYTVSNKEQGKGAKKKQHVSETSAQLSMELVFDTTDSGRDVRLDTGEIVKLLSPDFKAKKTPRMVEFSWGTYSFTGVIEQYKETLDFFSADGVPLRASVSLTLNSKELSFADPERTGASVDSELTPEPVVVPPRRAGSRGQTPSPADVANALGSPRSARAIAAANGAASLRFGAEAGLTLSAGGGLSAGAGAGFDAGAAASVGGGVTLTPAAAFSAGAGLGIGASAGEVAGGAFSGLRAASAITAAMPDPRPLIETMSSVSVGAGVQFGPGGRALSVKSGASLSADVGASAELSGRLTFAT